MTLIEKLSNLGGIIIINKMTKACSEITEEELRMQILTIELT